MSIIHVPSMISAVQAIQGAIIPVQSSKSRSVVNFVVEKIWSPNESDKNTLDKNSIDPTFALENIIVNLDESSLQESIYQSRKLISPWGKEDEDGTDALAWYVSFHRDPTSWGVYIPVTGLMKLALEIAPYGPQNHSWADVMRLSMRALLAHELIHYAADYAAGQMELIFNAPCYISTRTALSAGIGHIPMEEQLANSASLRSIRWASSDIKIKDAYKAAIHFTLKQPIGYRDGVSTVDTDEFLNLANELIRSFADHLPLQLTPPAHYPIDYTKFLPLGPLLDYRGRPSRIASVDGSQCPVYLIHDESLLNIPLGTIQYINIIPTILESARFTKELPIELKQKWKKTKDLMANPDVPKHQLNLDFKRWPKADRAGVQVWSVRIGSSGYRVHIEHYSDGRWVADSVGTKMAMGH